MAEHHRISTNVCSPGDHSQFHSDSDSRAADQQINRTAAAVAIILWGLRVIQKLNNSFTVASRIADTSILGTFCLSLVLNAVLVSCGGLCSGHTLPAAGGGTRPHYQLTTSDNDTGGSILLLSITIIINHEQCGVNAAPFELLIPVYKERV